MAKKYSVYKGLQKPLVFRGFKGKFIYWSLGCVLAGLVLGALTMSLINMVFGALVMISIIVGGLFYFASKQKRGLSSKERARRLYIHQTKFRNIRKYV